MFMVITEGIVIVYSLKKILRFAQNDMLGRKEKILRFARYAILERKAALIISDKHFFSKLKNRLQKPAFHTISLTFKGKDQAVKFSWKAPEMLVFSGVMMYIPARVLEAEYEMRPKEQFNAYTVPHT